MRAYRWNRDVETVDLGEVDVAGAIRLLDGCIDCAGREYEYAESAVADTVFWLINDRAATLTVAADAIDRIRVEFNGFELIEPKWFGLLLEPFTCEIVLPGRGPAIEILELFASTTDEQFRAAIRGEPSAPHLR